MTRMDSPSKRLPYTHLKDSDGPNRSSQLWEEELEKRRRKRQNADQNGECSAAGALPDDGARGDET